jgi:hypothetical protein
MLPRRSLLLWACSACALSAFAAAFPQPLVPRRALLAPRVGVPRLRCCTEARAGPVCALSSSRAARVHPRKGQGGGSRARALQVLIISMAALFVVVWCPATGAGENTAARTTRSSPQGHALCAAASWLRCSAACMVTAPRTSLAAAAAEATAAASAVTGPLHVRQGFFVLTLRCRRACWLCACIRACPRV